MTEHNIKNMPFLTIGKYIDKEYIGVVSYSDNVFVHIYTIDSNFTKEMKEAFILLSDDWWSNSNRKIPINLYHQNRWVFENYLKIFNRNMFEIMEGPQMTAGSIFLQKPKRKSIIRLK